MKAKEAIAQAKALLGEFYADEDILGVRLEEVEYEEPSDTWLITLSILHPAPEPKARIVQASSEGRPPTRSYKLLRISNNAATVPSMKIRELQIDA